MKKILFLSLGALLCVSLAGCTSSEMDEPHKTGDPEEAQLYGVNLPADEFGSRALIDPTTEVKSTIWQVGDKVGVFATSGPQQSQVEYVVETVDPQTGWAKFENGSYFNKKPYTFVSYFPLDEEFLRYTDDIDVKSLADQKQISNNDVTEQSKLLFNVTKTPAEPDNELRFVFEYTRLWSLVSITLTLPEEEIGTEWTEFAIKAPNGVALHNKIKYNFSKAEGLRIIYDDESHASVSMQLGDGIHGITASGTTLKLYMLVCPTNTETPANQFIVMLKDAGERVFSAPIDQDYPSFRKYATYNVTASPVFSSLAEDIRGTGHNFDSIGTK